MHALCTLVVAHLFPHLSFQALYYSKRRPTTSSGALCSEWIRQGIARIATHQAVVRNDVTIEGLRAGDERGFWSLMYTCMIDFVVWSTGGATMQGMPETFVLDRLRIRAMWR